MRVLSSRSRSAAVLTLVATAVLSVGCADRFNSGVVDAYLFAHNEQSWESMSALFHDDAEFRGPDGTLIAGREALDGLSQWYATVGSQLTTEVLSSKDDEVTLGSVVQKSEMLRELGIDQIEMESGSVFRFEGGLIRSVQIAPMTEESRVKLSDASAQFFAWALENRTEAAVPLMEAPPRLSAETATAFLAALEDWKAEGRP